MRIAEFLSYQWILPCAAGNSSALLRWVFVCGLPSLGWSTHRVPDDALSEWDRSHSGLFHHLLALRIEVIHFAIPVRAHGKVCRYGDLITEVHVAVRLLP